MSCWMFIGLTCLEGMMGGHVVTGQQTPGRPILWLCQTLRDPEPDQEIGLPGCCRLPAILAWRLEKRVVLHSASWNTTAA